MNVEKLKAAEQAFLSLYPGGFDNPLLMEMGKKHRVEKRHQDALDIFEPGKFTMVDPLIENTVKLVSRASVVSVFEKPKFKEYMFSLSDDMKHEYADALYGMLHGDIEVGFERMVDVLAQGKLAKWSLMTVLLYYYRPTEEVFVKPTTCKNTIKYFELEHLHYKPRPSYAFYKAYKEQIIEMTQIVDKRLSPDFGAFGGFLMMSVSS